MIPAGEISITVNISIHADNIFEANESFILTIDSSTVPGRVIVQPDCMTVVTIVDDDGEWCFEGRNLSDCFVLAEITVTFDRMEYYINEAAGVVKPLLVLSGPSSFVETVQVITVSRTADGMYIHSRNASCYV